MLNTLASVGFIISLVALVRGKLVELKIKNRKQAIVVMLVCSFVLILYGSKSTVENVKVEKPEVKTVEKSPTVPTPVPVKIDPVVTKDSMKEAWLKNNFSAWDGSNRDLVKLVKKSLNDPGSFEHEETTFDKSNDEFIRVKMVYRAKNSFGALILQNIVVKINYETKEMTVISQNV
jgi:hypothetical protein